MNRTYIKNILFLYLLAVILLCTACAKDLPTVQNMAEEQRVEALPMELVISHNQSVNSPEDFAARAMQSKLQKLLGDSIKVILYADYQMGSAKEQLEATQLERIHITIQPASIVSAFVDDMKVFTLPYLFSPDAADTMAVLDSLLEQEALERIDMMQQFTGLGLWYGGYKLITFHGDDYKSIHSPADFQGLKMAVPYASILNAQYRHWGAEPMEANPPVLYGILAQRIADGSEATASQITSNYLYEVQHNMVQAYHRAEIYVVLANRQWFDALPESLKTAILEAEAYAKETLYETLARQEPNYLETIRQAEGMRYETLSEKEQAVFRASVQPLYIEQLSGSVWQMEYVEKVQAQLGTP